MPLKIAAKVDRADQSYWEEMIRPMVEACPNVEFLGEIGEAEKASFLGGAAPLRDVAMDARESCRLKQPEGPSR